MTEFRALGPERLARTPATGPSVDLARPTRALAVGAHPDDVDFFASGTLAKWAAAGTQCSYLVLTDGSKGAWTGVDPAELRTTRAAEQRRAADTVGADAVVVLGHEDGFLVADLGLRREIALQIRALRPDVVLGHDPWRPYRLHPDHRAAGFATLDAVAVAREPLAYADANEPAHRPDVVMLFETDAPDHFESIDVSIDTKLRALLAHESQYESTMDITDSDPASLAEFEDRVREWAATAGARAGFDYAEGFKLIPV